MAEGFHLEDDKRTLERILDLAKKNHSDADAPSGEITAAFQHYVSQVVHYATGEDKNWDVPDALLDRAVNAWTVSKVRKPGEHIIDLRIEDATAWREKRLVLDIITDDTPFLVDSISGALTDAGKPVSFFLNAIVDTVRDDTGRRIADGRDILRESMIHAEMDPVVKESEIEELRSDLHKVLQDVHIAVADWESMRARLGACIAQLERARPAGIDRSDQREAVDFLKWLWDNRFAFLGVRHYAYNNSNGVSTFTHDPTADLGILRDSERRVLKSTYAADGHVSPAVEDFMQSNEPLLVAKTNAKSLVHRRVYMDYIGVKTYSLSGEIIGEDRFVGLFTSEAYNRPASDIPLLRAKVRKVTERAEFISGGHNEKALINILETYPRDEMFQVDVPTLADTGLGILRLYKRPRVKLFLRRDRFDRFISALVFFPRDRFSSDEREAVGRYLAETFEGRVSAFYPSFSDATLVRVQYIIGIEQGAPEGPGLTEMTRAIRAICREWRDDLLEEFRSNAALPTSLYERYENAFETSYREHTSTIEAIKDIEIIETLGSLPMRLRVYRKPEDAAQDVRIKLYSANGPLALSRLIPTLENIGLCVAQETGHNISQKDKPENIIWIHDFYAQEAGGRSIDVDGVKSHLEEALSAIILGASEDDPFNALVVLSRITWREAWLLRAAAKHHMQAGFSFSPHYIAETLCKHPDIVRNLINVFHSRFNPAGPSDLEGRTTEVNAAEERVLQALEDVSSLDEDRIIRRYLTLFGAITRTNFYQLTDDGNTKPYISFKIDSHKIEEMPEPKPYREIFVSGPRVDGVHLRFGPVARGGLRWSDRREDFRTEVLGLVKAQRVKNAVIVPTGSKGGFYPKQLPINGDRNEIYEEGREAYKIFIRGLLDVTDNMVGGAIAPPKNVVRWDDDDAYLVVAADKGTATFSDTANAISQEYGFWLGDAFASGGSAGYDHKQMGITARGAWEAVKRHFREMGKDIQTEPFTVCGVGDMSGDVFGNGMLLSEQIKLVAAFDHRDIFIDPAPEPATSYAERKRLFETPRTSWQDYNSDLISKGGGVFSRAAKSLTLSQEIRDTLNISAEKVTPNELINAILKAKVELFWLGGIGTYFKASHEENWRVGDRTNDAIRINAEEMQMSVIGEGANLGLTQDARIIFSRNGGRINTDAIDNSAGVDSSDHEVNIKILLSSAIEQGALQEADRNALLEEMTDDVAHHVLVHNYEQTRAVTQQEATCAADIGGHARLMSAMEADGRLDREIENLPSAEEVISLQNKNQGLTRPELSVLLAYAKNWLFEELMLSDAPDDPILERELFEYFPERLHTFGEIVKQHPLRREIIATRLANEVIDTCGSSFPFRAVDATGVSFAEIGLSYEAARCVLNIGDFAVAVNGMDNKVSAQLQTELYNTASNLLREQMYRIASGAKTNAILVKSGIQGIMQAYCDPITEIRTALPSILPARAASKLAEETENWRAKGAPDEIAAAAATMPALELIFDIANLAKETGWTAKSSAAVYFSVGEVLQIDLLRDAAGAIMRSDYFDKLAVRRLTEDLALRQAALSKNLISSFASEPDGSPTDWMQDALDHWREKDTVAFTRYETFLDELDIGSAMSIGKLSLLNRKLYDIEERLNAD